MTDSKIMVALVSFKLARSKKFPTGKMVRAGTPYPTTSAEFKAAPKNFKPLEDAIEQATAAPGEKRAVKRK